MRGCGRGLPLWRPTAKALTPLASALALIGTLLRSMGKLLCRFERNDDNKNRPHKHGAVENRSRIHTPMGRAALVMLAHDLARQVRGVFCSLPSTTQRTMPRYPKRNQSARS